MQPSHVRFPCWLSEAPHPETIPLHRLASILVGFVALEHLWFLILEMFLWQHPAVIQGFGTTAALSRDTAILAANQGLYNGILAAGLLWSLRTLHAAEARRLKTFFLSAIVVAGVYGGLTAFPFILAVQGLPAFAALILVRLGARRAVTGP
jgi:putative membrane protein